MTDATRQMINRMNIFVVIIMGIVIMISESDYGSNVLVQLIFACPGFLLVSLIVTWRANRKTGLEWRYVVILMACSAASGLLLKVLEDAGAYTGFLSGLGSVIYLMFMLLPYNGLYFLLFVILWMKIHRQAQDFDQTAIYRFWKHDSFDVVWLSLYIVLSAVYLCVDTDPSVFPEWLSDLDSDGWVTLLVLCLIGLCMIGLIAMVCKYHKTYVPLHMNIWLCVCTIWAFGIWFLLEQTGFHQIDVRYPVGAGQVSWFALLCFAIGYTLIFLIISLILFRKNQNRTLEKEKDS